MRLDLSIPIFAASALYPAPVHRRPVSPVTGGACSYRPAMQGKICLSRALPWWIGDEYLCFRYLARDDILSPDARSIHMLTIRPPEWRLFEGLPVAAELSDSGYYIAVGTTRWRISCIETARLSGKNFPGAICHIALLIAIFWLSPLKTKTTYKLYGSVGNPAWGGKGLLQLDYVWKT